MMPFNKLPPLRLWFCIACVLMLASGALAQPDAPALIVETLTVAERPDIFGNQTLFAEGVLANTSADAHTNITLYAEIYDADDAVIGEGIGFLVNECGTGLADFALQPDHAQPFSVALEFYEPDALTYERIALIPQATAIEPTKINPFLVAKTDAEIVVEAEVVAVEWIDAARLRYAVGCDDDVFSAHDWYEYDLETQTITALDAHPKAENITEAMLRQLGLIEPGYFERSALTYHPEHSRLVYQTELNTVITAERDGSFKRIIYDNLSRMSLQGYLWLPEGRFLAYYYGAYGDPVRYFTASMAGQRISSTVYDIIPSQTVPGAVSTGAHVVIGITQDDQTGYFYASTTGGAATLLYEADLPGNNYPAPVYVQGDAGAQIYVVRPIDGQPWLECFNRQSETLHALTALPLSLSTDDRAWAWLSPDQTTLAIAANGQAGGLWLLDTRRYACD